MRILTLVAAATTLASCSDSALRIRLVFPDAQSITLARQAVLYAVDPGGDLTCAQVDGRTPEQLGERVVAQVTIDLDDGSPRFPELPMRSMLLAALVYDAQDTLYMTGCEPVEASPGDDLEVVVYLDCAPGRTPCRDRDGDGVTGDKDCDDQDPCRSPRLTEAPNLCGLSGDPFSSADFAACQAALLLQGKTLTPPLCGDGVDQDCDGKDVACFTDGDCDGYPAPADCDDTDAKVNPGATETCDGKDNNCNKVVDEGCAPCDVDGDGHGGQAHTGASCTLPLDDPDDYDAGVHPGTTTKDGGAEGGTLLGALRGYCSTAKEKNGKLAQRDVDHDGDGTPASGDGCPPVTCDQDGDGYMNASCNPAKSQEDCNDSDAEVFPGAPERCGDGVAQSCVADGACGCDGDGDGYCPPADCDDKDAAIHPWATEVCDRQDNDCDELIDEGNPDLNGAPIPTDRKLCSDDNDGKCAPACTGGVNCYQSTLELTGVCACSAIDTRKVYIQDSGNRVICTGEDLSLPGSPRCFGANQPAVERCDSLDWSCDGKAFVTGEAFVELGRVCGTETGECTAGTVTGCDLQRTVDPKVSSVMTALGVAFSPHWVCSSGTKLPGAEVCNGRDDDCDGYASASQVQGSDPGWAELNEQDADGDGYIVCTSCQGASLAAGLSGCSDCDDGAKAVHPGAFEACDGTDNNCKSGDEGLDECAGTTCCAAQKACRNLKTDPQNCGACGSVCPPDTSDVCVNGSCRCGNTGYLCTDGRNCVSGSCQCVQGGLCGGCCDSNSCLPGTQTSACGSGGAPCTSCSTSNPCKTPVCNASGTCATTNKTNGTTCPGGLCYGGTCCTGCWDGTTCRTGTTITYCGSAGGPCQTCTVTNPCRTPVCVGHLCGGANVSDGTPCGSNGTCYSGSCCSGCWDGTGCRSGTTDFYCGSGGDPCEDCDAQSLACISQVCQ